MKAFIEKFRTITSSPRAAPWMLLLVTLLAYGLFVWRYGFYWDDLPISWIRYQLGVEAMRVYFSTSRPVWAVLYEITTGFIPQVPLYWQVFALIWRWLGVVLLWLIMRELWNDRPRMALIVALFFLLYPAFDFQWVSFLSTHFFIVICIFLLSQWLTLRALKTQNRYWLFTIIASVLSLLNLWMLEYFYSLEFIRLFIIFYALYQVNEKANWFQVSRRAFVHWLPYLTVFIINVLYRSLVFTNVAYQNVLLANLRSDPWTTILALAQKVVSDVWLVSARAWMQVFRFPTPALDGPLTTLLYGLVVLAVGVVVFIFLSQLKSETSGHRSAYWAIGVGFIALLLSGGPYWLASLEVTLAFPANRFTLSFMLGVSLLLAGALELIPMRARYIFAAILVALAAGRQVRTGDAFRRDWEAQKNLFWQLAWRAPALKPDTLVLMNEELSFYADNSISAPLNWIYAPDSDASHINYVLFYPTNRLGKALPELKPNIPIHFGYIAGDFNGNTSNALAFYYDPPACLRLLDPDMDSNNRFIRDESLMREASALSNSDRILRAPSAVMPGIYLPEPEHGWCYYFEKAELARQFGDWEAVAALGDQAFRLDDSPNNPVERFVFIEGYAHAGDWERAIELSKVSYRVSKEYVGPLLCRLWERVETETTSGTEQDALTGETVSKRSEALSEARRLFACNS